jgi:uncharacterized protein DUF3592
MYTSIAVTAFAFSPLDWDLLGLAGAFALAGVQRVWRHYQLSRSETWPISYGSIDRATVDGEQKSIKLALIYTYRVGEERFTGTFRKTFLDHDEANRWAEALSKKQVAVRYDPAQPSRSQLRESDLEPMVQAAAPIQSIQDSGQEMGWRRILLLAGLVSAIAGLAISVAMLIGEIAGKTLVPLAIARLAGAGALLLFGVLWLGRKGTRQQVRATPAWMKFLEYALFYYALFTAAMMSSHRVPGAVPGAEHHRGTFDARYNLFLYFSVLEGCYGALGARDEPGQQAESVSLSSLPKSWRNL